MENHENMTNTLSLPANFQELATECGVEPENLDALRENTSNILSLGRRSVDQTFDYGAYLTQTAALLPPGGYGKWVDKVFSISRRHADNFIRVHTELGRYRRRLAAAGVSSTVLFKLAGRSPDEIETVLKRFEAGERLTVREIGDLLKSETEEEKVSDVDLCDIAGIAGLRALAQAKLKVGIPSFSGRMNLIIGEIEAALDPFRRGKRVAKAKLGEKVQHEARLARGELKNLALFVGPGQGGIENAARPLDFPKDSGWDKVETALRSLGVVEGWPSAEKLGRWLDEEILPLLQWAVERPGTKPAPKRVEVTPPPLAQDEPDGSDLEVPTAEGSVAKSEHQVTGTKASATKAPAASRKNITASTGTAAGTIRKAKKEQQDRNDPPSADEFVDELTKAIF